MAQLIFGGSTGIWLGLAGLLSQALLGLHVARVASRAAAATFS